jgi:DNA-binding PadR family transcriptional regulator
MAFPMLEFLAINPNSTGYGIEKATKIDRPTVHATLKLLLEKGLVKITQEEKRPTGLIRREYEITPQGIVAVLQSRESYADFYELEYLREITKHHASFLPLVFGKWVYFQSSGVEEDARHSLYMAVNATAPCQTRLFNERQEEGMLRRYHETVLRHDIYEAFLTSPLMTADHPKYERWLQMVREDNALCHMADREMERKERELEERMAIYVSTQAQLRGERDARHWLFEIENRFDLADVKEQERLAIATLGLRDFWKLLSCEALDSDKPLPSLTDAFDLLLKGGQLIVDLVKSGMSADEAIEELRKLSNEGSKS